jgi:DNA-binding transcriptional LysR family regulator
LAHPEHPVPAGDAPGWPDLAGQTFVDFPPDWGIRRLNDIPAARAGVDRLVGLEVNDVHTLLDLVRLRLGVAIVPRSIALKDKAAGLAAHPLADDTAEPWRAALLIADGERAGPAATAFGRLVEDLVGPNENGVALAHAAP